MKVYVLLRGYDYEGSDVIKICKDKKDANKRLKYLNENIQNLRDCIGEKDSKLWKWWEKEYRLYPGEFYTMEEWEVN